MTEEQIKKRLNRDTRLIVDGILKEMKVKPFAIYLCGGQGRDEGSWYIGENGKPNPYNDYDIAVISNTTIGYDRLQTLRKGVAEAISIHWVDIDFYTPDVLYNLSPTIHNVDLLRG